MAMKPMFAVEDVKAQLFGPPMVISNQVEAIRGFEQAVNDPNTNLHKYASDFRLVRIGNYDESKGRMFESDHLVIAWASELKRPDAQLPLPVELTRADLERSNG